MLLQRKKEHKINFKSNIGQKNWQKKNKRRQTMAKSGRRSEIDEMHEQLKPFGIMQFVRSGRIAVSKDKMQISSILKEFSI